MNRLFEFDWPSMKIFKLLTECYWLWIRLLCGDITAVFLIIMGTSYCAADLINHNEISSRILCGGCNWCIYVYIYIYNEPLLHQSLIFLSTMMFFVVNWINMFTSTIMKITVIQCCEYYVDPIFKSNQFHNIDPTLKS